MIRGPDHAPARPPAPGHGGPDPREASLARTLGVPDLVARVLLARGLHDPEAAREHLRPSLSRLHDPFLFTAMERAVDRVQRAIRTREPILIHGDYDVDGISGTVLLLKLFQLMQVEARPFIPARSDGYSFSAASLRAVQESGAKLCISVDNGTNAGRWITAIQEAGCDVIVTDHHGTSEDVAPAFAVLNPRLPEAGYPDRELAGVGVAFTLASAIARSFSRSRALGDEFQQFLIDAVAYVALGTIADVAPLRGENRILVHHGLRALAANRNPGLLALLDSAGLSHRSPDAEDVSFRIAPLVNAAGRVGHAMDAVELLVARGYQEAQAAAQQLERHNQIRRAVEKELLATVLEQVAGSTDPVLVLGGAGWHTGVLGIVAARVAEAVQRPVLLVGLDGARGRGSGRSAAGIDLRQALVACSPCLLSHGGHPAAVGFELETARLDELRARLCEHVGSQQRRAQGVEHDGPARLADFDPHVVRKLECLGPFGVGNRRPAFVAERLRIAGQPIVDSRGDDLRFRVVQDGVLMPVRWKGGATRLDAFRGRRDIARLICVPRLYQGNGDGPVELQTHEVPAG